MKTSKLTAPLLAALAIAAAPASAATLNLIAAYDAHIRGASATVNNNYGNDTLVLIGDTTTANDFIRGAFAFDLSDPALAGATINSVTLTLTIASRDTANGGSANAAMTINLHELSSAFIETGVSWNNRQAGTAWGTAGGDFGSVISSTSANAATVNAGDSLVFSGLDLTSAVSDSVSGTFFVLAKLGLESASDRNIFRITSTESTAGTNGVSYPVLSIDYTPAAIPEPSAFAALAGLGALGLVGARRRRR